MKNNRVAKRVALVVLLASVMMLALPSFAFASESGGFSLLIPSMVEFIPLLIAFIILWIILAKFAIPMIFSMEDKRTEKITSDLKAAEDAKVQSEALLEKRQAELDNAKSEASKIITDAKKTGEAARDEIQEKAREDAQSLLDRANGTIELERQAALADLQGSVADLSLSIASRLIGEDLSDDQHRAIIERYVAEAGSLNAN